jgi:hypothetical protein
LAIIIAPEFTNSGRKNRINLGFIAAVNNMFRLEGVYDSIKSPLAPLFEKGGNVYTPTLLIVVIGVQILFQAFISSPFGKGGQGDLIKRPIGTYF